MLTLYSMWVMGSSELYSRRWRNLSNSGLREESAFRQDGLLRLRGREWYVRIFSAEELLYLHCLIVS